MKKKNVEKKIKDDIIKERKNSTSKWHRMTDKEFYADLKKRGLYEYENKHVLDADTWSDYFSFQQGSWDDVL